MKRFLLFLRLVLALTTLMFGAWYLSAILLPEGALRPYFARLFSMRVGEFTFWRVFLANLVPFFGVQFMNLFRVNERPGGLYVLPVFWILVGILYGTNSFVFATEPVPFSLTVLWTGTGFNELLAYTLGYEASREWAIWKQEGLWRTPEFIGRKARPSVQDMTYWGIGLLALLLAVAREVR